MTGSLVLLDLPRESFEEVCTLPSWQEYVARLDCVRCSCQATKVTRPAPCRSQRASNQQRRQGDVGDLRSFASCDWPALSRAFTSQMMITAWPPAPRNSVLREEGPTHNHGVVRLTTRRVHVLHGAEVLDSPCPNPIHRPKGMFWLMQCVKMRCATRDAGCHPLHPGKPPVRAQRAH